MTPKLIATGIVEGGLLPMDRSGLPHRHVSAVIKKLCLKLGHFAESDPDYTRFEFGSAFEDAVTKALAHRHMRAHPERFAFPGELELDGMIGTPDLYDLIDSALVEVKLTWLSAAQDPGGDKFWKYWVQCKAYCKMLGVSLARLHVGHINGDYRDNRNPIYNIWEAQFTQQELDDNWRMILTNADPV